MSGHNLLFPIILLIASCLNLLRAPAAEPPPAPGPVPADYLTLRELTRRVLARNENLQTHLLEMEINRQRAKGEKGIFEPEIVGTYDHEESKRHTTLQEEISTRTTILKEENNLYSAGLEGLLPLGTRVRLGYTLKDLRNNLDSSSLFGFIGFNPLMTNHQYASFAGMSLVQPFLKNGGLGTTLSNIRLAAMASDVAFQEYRRQLMLTLSKAEAAYWNLYLSQEQLLFFKDSVALAATVLNDNQERLKAGKGSELEVLEAQSGLALRTSKQAEARQKYFEALNQLTGLYSESVITTNLLVMAVDAPAVSDQTNSYFQSWQMAFDWNPDYLIQRKKLLSENIRLAYARNQRLPQLDLKASYGLNGLGPSANSSLEQLETSGFPSWSVGVEMRIPIGGGFKSRAEYNAAKLRQRQALLGLKELETQMANMLDTSRQRAETARATASSYQMAVDFNRNLLEGQLARLKVGKIESRKVLEVEADLFEARNALVEAKVQYHRALLEQELLQGSVLKARHLELSRQQLEEHTRQLLRGSSISDAQFQAFLYNLQITYLHGGSPPMDTTTEGKAREMLHDHLAGLEPLFVPAPAPTRPMTSEELDQALRTLRETLHQNPPPQYQR